MSRWEQVDSAVVPGGAGELRLLCRGDEFSIRIPGQGELMNSRTHGSEDALGAMACDRVTQQPRTRVLIGGLGMGFTLSSALIQLAADAQVMVAELVPEVISWNEGPLGECAGHPLHDPRVRVHQGDVAVLIAAARELYDVIVLDVDNGPEGLVRRSNEALYSLSGLSDAYRALKAPGTLAVWSAAPAPDFSGQLHKAGFTVDERRVRAHRGKGARHVIWLAQRESRDPGA